jgi:glycerophosphoryl diester phosphodiesterase
MKTVVTTLMTGILLAGSTLSFSASAADKMVIAHRGASGYLPEHTLPAKRWPTRRAPIILSRTW